MEKENLIQFFLAAAEQSRARVHFWGGPDQVESFSYGQLAEEALKVAAFLQDIGIKKGQRVAIVLPTHPDFYRAFFGVLLAGAIPSALYPPVRLGKIEEWKSRTGRMLQALQCQAVLTNRSLHSLLAYPAKESRPPRGVLTVASILKGGSAVKAIPAIAPADIAFIQFSSGTGGFPKPVRLSHENVLHNARFILGLVPGDPKQHHCVSWLPVYHDMGLVGTLISCMVAPADITLIPPELFLARPKTWLEALTRMKGSISVAPNFAYGLCCKRISEDEISQLDLSLWQTALCGAEPVQGETLRLFAQRFQKAGFDPRAFAPAYGLAEATLAVAISAPGQGIVETCFARDSLDGRGPVVPAEEGTKLVSVGRPLSESRIEIRNEQGQALEAGWPGRIWIKGPSVMQGYIDDSATERVRVNGWLDTGDRGFLFQENLYLCGRYKDLIIIRGRNHDPATIEESLNAVPGIRTGCAVAFGESDAETGTERLVILAEYRDDELEGSLETLADDVREVVLRDHQLSVSEVVLLKSGTLPRTSSGKKQRSLAKDMWKQHSLKSPEGRNGWIYFRERIKGYFLTRFS